MTFSPKNTFVWYFKSGTSGIRPSSKISKLACFLIGVGAIFTGLTSSVSASPIVRISGQSLQKLENRNTSKDYSSILSETQSISATKPLVLNQNNNTATPVIQIPVEILQLIKKVKVNTGGSSLDDDQVLKVQYRVE